MGFFVRELHNHIAALHSEQYTGQNSTDSFVVYRGQGLSQENFEQVMKTKGGLLAFNNFLSTSKVRDVSLDFAQRTMTSSNLVGVLFVMMIDPTTSSTPFADGHDVSAYEREEEILFSMHSLFRIKEIKQIDGNDHLWQVDLTLTGDNDPQLHALTEQMREETKGSTGCLRLGKLMMKLAQYNEAEDLHKILLAQTTNEREKGDIHYQLGCIKFYQGKYANAMTFYEDALQFREKTLTSEHFGVADCYNDISLVYDDTGEYSKAFSSHEKAHEIYQKTLPTNHPQLGTSYSNIGLVYDHMGEYSKALSSYEKALEIRVKTLPANHPGLAISYAWHGSVYQKIGKCSKALSYHEKAHEIYQKILPATHPDLATSYNNIGMVYYCMGDYSKALSYYEIAYEICQKTLPANHPHLATYDNIGLVYKNMEEYPKALSYFERTLDIWQCSLPPNHPDLQGVRKSIAIVKKKL
jgi:tetratricopeptide (TPR) repeat protein